jgi:hypothetical protein
MAAVSSGYRFGAGWRSDAYAAVQAQSFRTPGYSEVDGSGGGFGLAYNAHRYRYPERARLRLIMWRHSTAMRC